MPEQQSQFPVVTSDGVAGVVLRRARFLDRDARSLVRLQDGREFEVPNEALEVRQDGSFLLHEHASASATTQPAPESSEPSRNGEETETRMERTTRSTNATDAADSIEEALYGEEADIRRVPVNQIVAEAPQTRQEGDVTIVPVVEEVLVVEKRLLLKEEIHIIRRRAPVREPRRIVTGQTEQMRS